MNESITKHCIEETKFPLIADYKQGGIDNLMMPQHDTVH